MYADSNTFSVSLSDKRVTSTSWCKEISLASSQALMIKFVWKFTQGYQYVFREKPSVEC